MNKETKRAEIRKIIDDAGSQFVTVAFVKKDKTERRMNIQPLAIRSHIVGEAASESAQRAVATRKENHPELYPCWDVKAEGIRSINLDTVFEVKKGKKVYTFEPAED